MTSLVARMAKLEQAVARIAPASPSLVVVLADGRYRLADGREMRQADFERLYPDGVLLRVTGFEGV